MLPHRYYSHQHLLPSALGCYACRLRVGLHAQLYLVPLRSLTLPCSWILYQLRLLSSQTKGELSALRYVAPSVHAVTIWNPCSLFMLYESLTRWLRVRQVKKGRWPGGPKHLIHSSNVLNGGASPRQAELLYQKEFGVLSEKRSGSRRYRNGGNSRSGRHNHGSQQRRSSPRPPSVYSMDRGRR